MSQPVKTNHALHLVMTILTGGLWIPVWVIVAAINNNTNAKSG